MDVFLMAGSAQWVMWLIGAVAVLTGLFNLFQGALHYAGGTREDFAEMAVSLGATDRRTARRLGIAYFVKGMLAVVLGALLLVWVPRLIIGL